MRQSRYNYRRHVNEEDEEVPKEAGNNPLTQKMRHMRTSTSRGRDSITRIEDTQNSLSAKVGNRNGAPQAIEQVRLHEPYSATKAHSPLRSNSPSKPSNKGPEPPKSANLIPSNKAERTLDPKETQLQQLNQERDRHKTFKQKKEEYQKIVDKFQNLKKPASNRAVSSDSKNPVDHDSKNPYKRDDVPHTPQLDPYHSVERQREIEKRRHRNSAQKDQNSAKKSYTKSEGTEGGDSKHQWEQVTPVKGQRSEDAKTQTVNINLFKRDLAPLNVKPAEDRKTPQYVQTAKAPELEEDFEEVIQTIENGVVVEESRRIVKSAALSKDQHKHGDIDVNEDFETHDIDEVEKEVAGRMKNRQLKARSKQPLFQEREARQPSPKKSPFYPTKEVRPGGDATNAPDAEPEPVSMLEESEEVVMFDSDSKLETPSSRVQASKRSVNSQDKVDYNNFMLKDYSKQKFEDDKQRPEQIDTSDANLAANYERDSPGPKRDAMARSIQNKHLDEGSMNDEQMYSDENSDSSGDILPNPYDIKKMVPYDQRKEPGGDEASNNNKKLNIMYEELEDSGSEGSDPRNREDPNHLASIIEEEEEATEYQRSRSRSRSGNGSPVPSNAKLNVGQNLKSVKNPSKMSLSDIKEEKADKKETQSQKPTKQAKPIKREETKQKSKKEKKPEKTSDTKEDFRLNVKETDLRRGEDVDRVPEKQFRKGDMFESQSMKNPKLVDDRQSEIQDMYHYNQEHSVKLDDVTQEVAAPMPSTIKERKLKSPSNAKVTKRSESEKALNLTWHGSKHLKILFTILQELGDEKNIDFGDFFKFYLLIDEIANNKRINPSRTFDSLVEKHRRSQGRPEGNMPHFLWAFLNPDRHDWVKKKVVKDMIKACDDNKSKGRKNLLDSLEDAIRNDDKDSAETQKNIRLTFNYPGVKRALINFTNVLAKIDGRTTQSREANIFISTCLQTDTRHMNIRFIDPIQGLERTEDFEEQHYGDSARAEQHPSPRNEVDPFANEGRNTANVPSHSSLVDPDLYPRHMRTVQSNGVFHQTRQSDQDMRNIQRSHPESAHLMNDNKLRFRDEPQRFKIDYEEDLDSKHRKSEQAYSEQPYSKLEGARMNVLNFTENKSRQNLDFQSRRYNEHATPNETRNKSQIKYENSIKSDEWGRGLHYKVPISATKADKQTRSSRDTASKRKPQNMIALRKQEDEYDRNHERYERVRDKTPKAKNTVNFEEPLEKKRVISKLRQGKSTKRTKSAIKKTKEADTQTPKKLNAHRYPTNKSVSSRRSSKKPKSTRKIDSEDENEHIKIRKSNKSKVPNIKYENDSSISEGKGPKRKIVVDRSRSKFKKKKGRKSRYQEDQEEDEHAHERSKSHNREKTPRDENFTTHYRSASQKPKKKEKKVLFQVDINMDANVVRISIHEGDNIDRIVEKFDKIFNLKPKQKELLTKRLKAQYQEMMG